MEGMSLLPETAELLLFCPKPKASAVAIISCHMAVRGEKSNYKVVIWGRLLNKEVQHRKTQATHLIQVICYQHLCKGESHQRCDSCYTSAASKCKPPERVLECRRSLQTGSGCSSWHPPSDSPVTHPQRAGTEATPASRGALLTLWGPGKHGQAGKS